jgi:hypothetical protein
MFLWGILGIVSVRKQSLMKVTCSNCGEVLGQARNKEEALSLATEHAPKCNGEVNEEAFSETLREVQRKKKGDRVFLHA